MKETESACESHEQTTGRTCELGDDFMTALAGFCREHGIRPGASPCSSQGGSGVGQGALDEAEALGCGTIASDPETGGILPHIHTTLGLKERSADGYTSPRL
ncbi:hypothetical protein [Nonomuraea roseoviolacea]|uniref:hypothetical protein n=1 Tax=Nonomuraea roseoviolacea TaxID=103837 RepID=UPI0031E06AA9